jgi:uncharacterized protein (TIGR03067 family)
MLIVLSVGLIVAADTPKRDTAKTEMERLQGSWIMIGGEEKGSKLTEEAAKEEKQSFIFEGDTVTIIKGDARGKAKYRLDPSKKPKWIDFIYSDGESPATNHAIYSLEGDELKICVSRKWNPNSSDERPPAFTTKREEGSSLRGLVLYVCKREKK